MLDTETKRRIDTARDILVGKVPDPKSQVEQITIAMIYKFMDDMDAESEEFGGNRTFFAGAYADYGWARLMHSGLGGQETLNLYAEAISKMPENPGIPALFRAIFKNAYLPYRDPETLKMFLKIIDEFSFEHSENLGDAFEYLLSVLGSQGDAGQFRTPRHIIDFMVEIIDPKKDEVVLDPACGTAGFLISSYKHILKANADEKGNNGLTPDEKNRLAQNFRGYDISPDMVRLSLVNLYLHGFADPHIHEYDTLTSLEKWNEYADVILANPPFMSPKGGIQPHQRFSVQSKRSEVLFVDYMAEHLTPNGRAAIIVPEGIIFQSSKAYVQLRKLLVEDYLVAVVSLPAGVFNPYSGVKTSILILDKALAKRSQTIAFFKVENDGFSLGAQRRENGKNDLPQALAEIAEYLRRLRNGEALEEFRPGLGSIVKKEKIAENGEYNLSEGRYKNQSQLINLKWPTITLGEICSFMTGGTPLSTVAEYYENGTIPWLVSGDIHKIVIHDCEKRITKRAVENSNAKILPKDSVLIALNGQGKTRGTVALLRMDGATCNQSLAAITPIQPLQAISEFIFWILRSMYSDIRELTGDMERSGLNIPILKSMRIPLPPLGVQKEIVAEIEGYQKVIDGARAVVENYRTHISVQPDWPMVEIGKVCAINPETVNPVLEYPDQTIFYIDISSIENQTGRILGYQEIASKDAPSRARRGIQSGDILLSTVRPNLKAFALLKTVQERSVASTGFAVLRTDIDLADPTYVLTAISSDLAVNQMIGMMGKGAYPSINQSDVAAIKIPLPSLPIQQKIVSEIEEELAVVDANRELIARFEKKIQGVLARVWGEAGG